VSEEPLFELGNGRVEHVLKPDHYGMCESVPLRYDRVDVLRASGRWFLAQHRFAGSESGYDV
jgi:hypothetical protein